MLPGTLVLFFFLVKLISFAYARVGLLFIWEGALAWPLWFLRGSFGSISFFEREHWLDPGWAPIVPEIITITNRSIRNLPMCGVCVSTMSSMETMTSLLIAPSFVCRAREMVTLSGVNQIVSAICGCIFPRFTDSLSVSNHPVILLEGFLGDMYLPDWALFLVTRPS